MFPYYVWQLVLGFVTLIPIIGGALIAAQYRRLSPHVNLIFIGFGAMTLVHGVSSVVQMALTSMIMRHAVGSGFSTSSYGILSGMSSSVFLLLNLAAWALILTGLSLTLRDLQSRLWMNQNGDTLHHGPKHY